LSHRHSPSTTLQGVSTCCFTTQSNKLDGYPLGCLQLSCHQVQTLQHRVDWARPEGVEGLPGGQTGPGEEVEGQQEEAVLPPGVVASRQQAVCWQQEGVACQERGRAGEITRRGRGRVRDHDALIVCHGEECRHTPLQGNIVLTGYQDQRSIKRVRKVC
jgi:hypothetical protein